MAISLALTLLLTISSTLALDGELRTLDMDRQRM